MSTAKKEKKLPRRSAKYPPEFQADAVAMTLGEDRKIADVARHLDTWPGRISKLERGTNRNDALATRYRTCLTTPKAV